MRTYFPHDDCVPSQMTEIRMQPSLMKVRPRHETQSSPREPSPATPPGHRPTRPLPTRTHHKPRGPPSRLSSPLSRACPRGSIGQPALRTRQALRVRRRRSTGPDSPGGPSRALLRSPRASSPAPRTIPVFLEECRADIGQHPQAHCGSTDEPLGNPYGVIGPVIQHVGCASPRLSPGV